MITRNNTQFFAPIISPATCAGSFLSVDFEAPEQQTKLEISAGMFTPRLSQHKHMLHEMEFNGFAVLGRFLQQISIVTLPETNMAPENQ